MGRIVGEWALMPWGDPVLNQSQTDGKGSDGVAPNHV